MSKFSISPSVSSGSVCECGKHKGLNGGTPHERAQICNWFRQRKPNLYDAAYKQYLESYEQEHGRLGVDEFVFNNKK